MLLAGNRKSGFRLENREIWLIELRKRLARLRGALRVITNGNFPVIASPYVLGIWESRGLLAQITAFISLAYHPVCCTS